MAAEFQVIATSHVVNLTVTSSINSFGSERRFQKDLTIGALKSKLELLTGSQSHNMKLEVYNKDNRLVCMLDNEDALLGSYHVDDGMRLHVVDKSGQKGEFEDVSKVEKFEISKEEYEKRTDSVKAFKERMKMGRFRDVDPEEQKRQEEEKQKKEQEEKDKAESIKVGERCEVSVPGQPKRRGAVMYSGLTDFKPGYWVGVKYDEPMGKNDGSVKGKRYFECPPKYGGFVKPQQIEVGDFPEDLDMDFEDDEM